MAGAADLASTAVRTHTVAALVASADSVTAGVLANVADIGSVGTAGTLGYSSDGTYTVSGSGAGLSGSSDGFTFASTPTVQDIVVSARVATIATSGSGGAAVASGVMIRNGGANATGAPMVALLVTNTQQLTLLYRTGFNTTAVSTTIAGVSAPQFVRLARSGFQVLASCSSDGVTWSSVGGPMTITFLNGSSRAGLVVTSGSTTQTNTSTFDQVAVIGGSAAWSEQEIGTAASPGSVGYDPIASTYELITRGSGLDGVADSADFVAQPLAGDGSVTARIDPKTSTDALAGVMIRANPSAGSPFAAVLVSNGHVSFNWRSTPGTAAQQTTVAVTTIPLSVRIIRQGNAFAGLYSTDGGATWQRVGNAASATIAMPTTVNAGLVAASTSGAATDVFFTGVSVGAIAAPGAGVLTGDDELFLNDLEQRTALWFTVTQNTTSGLFPDRANAAPGYLGGDASMAATGFGLSALVVAASRGWITDGYPRALRTLNFLLNNTEMKNPANHGYFYHFVNQTTGVRSGTSELSSIDTALLISGVLTVGQYWKGTPLEALATQIYNRVDWTFMQPDGAGKRLRMAWTPEGGFSSATWDSWSEGPLLYLLAMGSPTHPINAASWLSFARYTNTSTYNGQTIYDAAGAPLFTNQYPQAWFDLRAKSDLADADPSPTRVVHLDPFQNSKTHTLLQRQASIDAAAGSDVRYDYFGPNAWGLTASDSPTGYKVSGGPPINSDGTIAPTAPGGSLAFTPRESIDDLKNLQTTYPSSYRAYGFVDAFNPRPTINWYDNDALGIDQGMLLLASENLRSGLMWQTFMSLPVAQTAVALAFTDNTSFAPPALASSAFAFETTQSLSLAFTQDISASLGTGDLQIVNLTTGQTVAASSWGLSKSSAGQPTMATVTFFSPLPDGRYEVRIAGGSIARADGVTNVADVVASFFVLAGDADRDGSVTFNDLLILAKNYGTAGKTFSGGNFDYSSDGAVTFDDLLILARAYGTTLPAVTSPASATIDAGRPMRQRSLASEIIT